MPIKSRVTTEQLEWLRENYAYHRNIDLGKILGISAMHVWRLHKRYFPEIEKSPQMRAEKAAKMSEAHKRQIKEHGLHPNSMRVLKEQHWRGGRPGKQSAEEIEKRRARMAQLRRQEKARYIWGLPMRTRLRFRELSSAAYDCRYRLKKRGYITSRINRFTIWYDENTRRLESMERRAIEKHKFRFVPKEAETATDAPQSV